MVGMTDWMISPSSSSTSRSTPCVLGCWGPMLTVIVSVRMSLISVSALHAIAFEIGPELFLADFERRVGLCRLLNLDRVVLALWVPLPVLGHQQPPQVGVTVEHDAEHVPHFAFEPAGAGIHALHRRHAAIGGDAHLQAQPQPPRHR